MLVNRDLNQEQTAAENLLYQRLIVFLIVFSVFVIGAVNAQRKILFISILSLGVIICWVLTFIVIRTAKRIDNKSGGRLVRWLLGYLVPVFCSMLLTTALFFGSLGFIDPYLFSSEIKQVQLENKIDELKNDLVKRISPGEKKTYNDFKNIDSVIAEGKTVRSDKPLENISSEKTPQKVVKPKQNNESKYFKNVDSVIVSDKPLSRKNISNRNSVNPFPPKTTKPIKDSKNFKNIDSVIAKEKK